ncbi:hypothetical protein [Chryseobacterium wangxinyae]|uniref:hypothetical protein n=1 Tax=Chryseobacterium sp. CY353 TaxID=2997334 RepID=UPI0022704DE6|nr:hypothetical protein [Chryseobacterium sp. CY353]MCY0970769.1 hypothetical protein [Chryseobacterium sp. CY353]
MKEIFSVKSNPKKELKERASDFSQNTLQKVSFEKSKKILTESGLNLTDDEVKNIMDFAHQLADLIIKNYILK